MDCEYARIELAARALVGPEGAEESPVDEHVRQCPGCCAEQEENAAVLALLATVEEHELDGVPVPDPARAVARLRGAGPAATPPAVEPAGRAGGLPASAHCLSGGVAVSGRGSHQYSR